MTTRSHFNETDPSTMIGSWGAKLLGTGSVIKYNISMNELLTEYMNFAEDIRFGEYIIGKYLDEEHDFDYDVYEERNNGVAYKLILNRIYQQQLAECEKKS